MTAPANLTEMIKSVGVAATTLAEEVRADRAEREVQAKLERAQRRRDARRQNASLAIIAALVTALLLLSVWNRVLGNQNRSIISTIDSCTQPDGQCAKEGQQRTAEVLGELVRRLTQANIEVTACGRTASTDAAYRTCVDKAIAKLNAAPPSPTTPAPATPAPTPVMSGAV